MASQALGFFDSCWFRWCESRAPWLVFAGDISLAGARKLGSGATRIRNVSVPRPNDVRGEGCSGKLDLRPADLSETSRSRRREFRQPVRLFRPNEARRPCAMSGALFPRQRCPLTTRRNSEPQPSLLEEREPVSLVSWQLVDPRGEGAARRFRVWCTCLVARAWGFLVSCFRAARDCRSSL